MGVEGVEGARYRAFISYSHVDRAFGRRLHRRLEGYRLPGRLVGRVTARGAAPRRVAPVFRDREEFSAAHDLTAEIRAALAASGALIVVCSPHAMASPWVAREIELFRQLHPDRPVLAALAAGEPATAFPPPLTDGAEPLAADFRPEGDGPRLALMKLVAGVVGVGLDELVQRDAQRRLRAVTAVTAAAVGVALSMSALAVVTYRAQREAQRQRAEAEALVEFMLTDLRDRLKGVGRLDVLGAVNTRALQYYREQSVAALPPESLERRARVLHAMGEDDLNRGRLAEASRSFREAERTTGALLTAEPGDATRIWSHGQSRFWTGYAAFRQHDRTEAGAAWREYRSLSRSLAQREPRQAKYLREVGFAEGNLCTLELAEPASPAAALTACLEALRWVEAAQAAAPDLKDIQRDLANRYGWLSQAYRSTGQFQAALAAREREQEILTPLISNDPRNMALRGQWVAMQRAMIGLETQVGRRDLARARLQKARSVLDQMIGFDPSNVHWRLLKDRLEKTAEFMESGK